MTNQTSIKYITSLLDRPETITEGDSSSIALFRQTFPYFVPVRYLSALESHKKQQYSNQMLSAIQPYLGDWILFNNFLQDVNRPIAEMPVSEKPVTKADKKSAEVVQAPPAEAAPTVLPIVSDPIELVSDVPLPEVAPPTVVPAPVVTLEDTFPPSFAPVMAVVNERPELPVIERIKEKAAAIVPEPVHIPAIPLDIPEPSPIVVEEPVEVPLVTPQEVLPVVEELPVEVPVAASIPAVMDIPAEVAPVTDPIVPEVVAVVEEAIPEILQPVAERPVFDPPVQMGIPTVPEDVIINQPPTPPVAEVEKISPGFVPLVEQPYVPEFVEEIVVPAVPVLVPPSVDTVEASAFAKAWAEMESEAAPVIVPEPEPVVSLPPPVADEIEEAVEIVNLPVPGRADLHASDKDEDPLIFPIYTRDYFLQQGEKVSEEIPVEISELKDTDAMSEEDKSLMVVMSFSEWLLHFKHSAEKQREESKDQKALKTMWQKEKLAAAMEEENEEIPENVFEMAVNSISKEEGLVSETLAEIYIKQGKYDKAIEMYRKLSLKNPQKNLYFARKIEEALKDKQS